MQTEKETRLKTKESNKFSQFQSLFQKKKKKIYDYEFLRDDPPRKLSFTNKERKQDCKIKEPSKFSDSRTQIITEEKEEEKKQD